MKVCERRVCRVFRDGVPLFVGSSGPAALRSGDPGLRLSKPRLRGCSIVDARQHVGGSSLEEAAGQADVRSDAAPADAAVFRSWRSVLFGLSLADRVPDARTIWLFGEKLTRVGAIEPVLAHFDTALRASGFIVHVGADRGRDACRRAAPRQRNTEDEKKAIKEGRIPEAWQDQSRPSCGRRIATRAGR